jgi:iron complex transport system permease protein
MMVRRAPLPPLLWAPLLLGGVLVALLYSLGVGGVAVPLDQVARALVTPRDPTLRPAYLTIVWELRLARALLAALVGAGLAGSGTAFQGLFRNPLADPFVIGASSGAALGATLAIVSGNLAGGWPTLSVPLGAFLGAILAVLLVYTVSASGERSPLGLLLAGAALSTMLSALVSLLMLLNNRALPEIFAWLLGGFSGRGWSHLAMSAPALLLGLGLLWLLARPLDALSTGEESARSLGLPLSQARLLIVAAASLATAAGVAAGGIISFVGLIAPHIARMFCGTNHANLIPASALIGALLLLLADSVARSAVAPLELPVGILTAMLGGPFFLWLLHRGGLR